MVNRIMVWYQVSAPSDRNHAAPRCPWRVVAAVVMPCAHDSKSARRPGLTCQVMTSVADLDAVRSASMATDRNGE